MFSDGRRSHDEHSAFWCRPLSVCKALKHSLHIWILLAWILKCRLPSSPWRPCFSMFPAHLKGELTPRGKGTYRCIYPDFWTAVVLFCQWEQEVLLITHDPVRGAALVGPYKADPTLRRLCSPHTPSSSLASLMDWTAMALFFYNGTTPACWFV